MKTNREIQSEAQRLVALAGRYQKEQLIGGPNATAVAVPGARVILPVNDGLIGRERHVEATVTGEGLVFRLLEREADPDGSGRQEGNRDSETSLLAVGSSAYEVLRTGYEMAEEERLAAALEPYVERSEDFDDPADSETVGEVETILETNQLPSADRLRAKAEIVEFLEGRLEPSVFIANAVERQCMRDEGCRERLIEAQELKITVGEP